MKRLLILISLLALPAHAQWVTGSEQILTSPAIGPSGYNDGASVAASNDNFLAAWLAGPLQNPRTPRVIAVMPFASGGTQSQTESILGSAFSAPGAGSNGSEYLLAWTTDGAITVRRLAKDGTPLGAATTITKSRSTGQLPVGGTTRVGWDGAHYVVVATAAAFVNSFVQTEVEAAILDPDGSIVRNDLRFGGGETLLDAAAASGLTLALTAKQKALSGHLIDAGGNVSEPFAVTSENVLSAAVASDGTSFLAVWINDAHELRAMRIGRGGNLGDTETLATNAASDAPAAAWTGRDYVLSWIGPQTACTICDPAATQFTTLSDAEAGIAPPLQLSSAPLPLPGTIALAGANGTAALVTSQNVIVGRVIQADHRFATFPLSEVVLDQASPQMVGDVLFYLRGTGGVPFSLVRNGVVLRDDVIGYDVAPSDADAASVLLPTSQIGITVLTPAAPGGILGYLRPSDGNTPALASNGRTRLVAFRKGNAVWFFRVDANGTLLDVQPVQLSTGSGQPPMNVQAVWRGDAFIVTWQESASDQWLVKSARVEENGQHTSDVLLFTQPTAGTTFFGTAASGGVTAIAWKVDSIGSSELHVTRVDPDNPVTGIVAGQAVLPHSIALVPVPAGFDLLWIGEGRTAARITVSRDFDVSPPESLGVMPADDVTFVYGENASAPRLILYSKGNVIAARAIGKARRRAAAS